MKRNPLIPFGVIAVLGILSVFILSINGLNEGEDKDGGKAVAASGEEIYLQNCASCHGKNLEGAFGPALTDTDMSKDEVVTQILEGGGQMQPVNIPAQQAEKVADWMLKQ